MDIKEYEKIQPKFNIKINETEFNFYTPNSIYAEIYLNKANSKEYLFQWINRFENGAVLLDATAGTGFYSILAAKLRNIKVYSFEADFNDICILNKNIDLNKLNNLITSYCLNLSDETIFNNLIYKNNNLAENKNEIIANNQAVMNYRIDDAIKEKIIDIPTYLKISDSQDLFKTINGADNLLKSNKVKSISISIKKEIDQYEDVFTFLNQLDYYSNSDYYITKGIFNNTHSSSFELIFNKISTLNISVMNIENKLEIPTIISNEHVTAQKHTEQKIVNSSVIKEPFPHLVIDDIFPQDYYSKMQNLFPSIENSISIGETGRVSKGSYKERRVTLFEKEYFDSFTTEQFNFWTSFSKWFYSDLFIKIVLEKFKPWCASRLNDINQKNDRILIGNDALFVHDEQNYVLGPHTDAAHRLLTFLYYMPEEYSMRELGTYLYKSDNEEFICPGGPHYSFEGFQEVKKLEYLPNRLISFVRTGRSFHGVPKITKENIDRKLIINNVRLFDE